MKNKHFPLYPCFSISSVYALNFEKLYQLGYRALLFDIDNTLVLHDEPAGEKSEKLFKAKAYLQAVKHFQIEKEQTLFFGDQLFTDILGGNRAGVPTVLVKPVGKEKYFHILLKRLLEKPFLLAYQRKHALFREEIRETK